jgi:lipid II:glycine glycyltransferase (peptidoglycan interpeptide bridge formation enzyme)
MKICPEKSEMLEIKPNESVSQPISPWKHTRYGGIDYAIDEKGNIHSTALFAFDKKSVYYLMSGSIEEFRDSQSLTLLIYEGIKLASKKGLSFDFEGSMKKNIEQFFRQFGAKQKQYFDISKEMKK